MINSLTDKQVGKLSEYREKWLAIGLSTSRIDRKKAKENFNLFNKSVFGNNKSQLVIFMDSPFSAWIATCFLFGFFKENKSIDNQVRNQVRNQVWNQVRNQVWNQVRNQVDNQVRNQVWSQVENQVWNQVRNQVENQVENQVRNFIYPYLRGQFNSSYFSFYDFINKELNIKFKNQEKWDLYLRTSEVSLIYPFEDFCVISEKPTHIKINGGILHNEHGPSISYADGFSVYNLNGVRVDKSIVETPAENLDPKLLITESNAEIRREIIRKIGISRILQKLEAKKLDSWKEYELYRIQNIDIEPVHVVKMVCPSTGAYHAHRIPPEIINAREGIKWINHGIDKEEFVVEA